MKLEQVVEQGKARKQAAMERRTDGGMTPTVIIVKNDEVWGIVEAAVVNPNAGLHAAMALHDAIDPDVIIFITDGYAKVMTNIGKEEAEDVVAGYSRGALEQQFKENPENVSEVLICMSIDKAGKCKGFMLPYKTSGKTILWGEVEEMPEECQGRIPEALMAIVKRPTFINDPIVFEMGAKLGLNRDRQLFHGARAIFDVLTMTGFTVTDLVTPKHPDWVS